MNYYEASQIQLKARLARISASIEQEKKPKPKRPKPQTPYKGSWADEERQRANKAAEKDKRPTSIMLDGIVSLSNGVQVEFTSNGRI